MNGKNFSWFCFLSFILIFQSENQINCHPHFDSILLATQKIDHLLNQGSSSLSLTNLLKSIPSSKQEEFGNEFGSKIGRVLLSVTREDEKVLSAIEKAKSYISKETPEYLNYKLCRLATQYPSVPSLILLHSSVCRSMNKTIHNLAQDFAVEHKMIPSNENPISTVVDHAGRPAAPYYGSNGSYQSLVFRAFFWLSFAILHLAPASDQVLEWQHNILTSEKVRMEEQEQEATNEKWEIIVSAFSDFEQWKKVTGGSKKFLSLIAEMCAEPSVHAKRLQGITNERLEECWESRVAQVKAKLAKSQPMITLPDALAAFFALGVLLQEGSMATKECASDMRTHFECTNQNLPGSMCVLSCDDIYDNDGNLLKSRVKNQGTSAFIFCTEAGEWVGNTECLELPEGKNHIPPLGPPDFYTR